MIITVRREPDRSVVVGLERPHDPTPPRIQVDSDIADGESSFALFDCGAAVQQVDGDYLISTDWLRRQAVAGIAHDPSGEFERRLHGETDGFHYVESMDALRVAVGPASDEEIEPTATV